MSEKNRQKTVNKIKQEAWTNNEKHNLSNREGCDTGFSSQSDAADVILWGQKGFYGHEI